MQAAGAKIEQYEHRLAVILIERDVMAVRLGERPPGARTWRPAERAERRQIRPLANVARRLGSPPIVGQLQFFRKRLQSLEDRLIEIGVARQLAQLFELLFSLGLFSHGIENRDESGKRI